MAEIIGGIRPEDMPSLGSGGLGVQDTIEGINPVDPGGIEDTLTSYEKFLLNPPKFRGVEAKLAEHQASWAFTKFASQFIPYAQYLLPSGRDEFAARSTTGQTVDLMLEALGFAGIGLLGKGLKLMKRGVKAGAGKLGKKFPLPVNEVRIEANPFLDELMQKLPKFEYKTAKTRMAEKYKLGGDEAEAAMRGEPYVWGINERSGAKFRYVPENFKKLFKKDGTLNSKAAKDVDKWSQPITKQFRKHWTGNTKKVFSDTLARFGSDYANQQGKLFTAQALKLFGKRGAQMTMDNTSMKEVGNILLDTIKSGGTVRKQIDISWPAQFKPIRTVYGGMEGVHQGYSKIYKSIKGMFEESTRSAMSSVRTYHTLLASRGLIKIGKETPEGLYKFKQLYTKGQYEEAGKLAGLVDDMRMAGKSSEEINKAFSSAPEIVQMLTKSMHDWYDHMMGEFFVAKIPQLFTKAGLTEAGMDRLSRVMSGPNGVNDLVRDLFSLKNNYDHGVKKFVLENKLKELRKSFSGKPYLFTKNIDELDGGQLKELQVSLKNLVTDLTIRKPGAKFGFPDYLQNYTQRIPVSPSFVSKLWKRGNKLPEGEASFMKSRKLQEGGERITDVSRLISSRATQQAIELSTRAELRRLAPLIEELPPNLKAYTNHWVNRMLGNPTEIDAKMANWIGSHLPGEWNARRVQNLAFKLNDLTYMGGIGFKPFSAMRNYFQPFLLVPVDMGGIKNVAWLAKGYQKTLTEPATRAYIREIGAITQFVPDLKFSMTVDKYGKSGLDKTRDLAMWLFKQSDTHNRYVTGGAAIAKWDHFAAKFGKSGIIPDKNFSSFNKKLFVGSREPWIRDEINSLIRARTPEALEEAKKIWTKNVIADTQYLYGISDSPLITHTGGALGKTGFIFQSWWMNYGSTFTKWVNRADSGPGKFIDGKLDRMFTFMLTGAAGYSIMERAWGANRATSATLFGPFPTGVDLPPNWKPFAEGLKLLIRAGTLVTPASDMEDVTNQIGATLRAGSILIPGGIQFRQSLPHLMKGDLEGVAKSVIGVKK